MRSLRTRIPNTSPEGPNTINPLTPRDINGKRNKIRRKSEDMFYSSDDLSEVSERRTIVMKYKRGVLRELQKQKEILENKIGKIKPESLQDASSSQTPHNIPPVSSTTFDSSDVMTFPKSHMSSKDISYPLKSSLQAEAEVVSVPSISNNPPQNPTEVPPFLFSESHLLKQITPPLKPLEGSTGQINSPENSAPPTLIPLAATAPPFLQQISKTSRIQPSQSGNVQLPLVSNLNSNQIASSPHLSLSSQEEGVYLSGGRTMTMSPAFGSEPYDALQRDQVLRSMNSGAMSGSGKGPSSQNLAALNSLPIPRIVSGEKNGSTDLSLRSQHRVSGSVSDFLGDNTVSLLSSVPAAMQQQQYPLSMAMNGSGNSSVPLLGPGGLIESGGPYLAGVKVTSVNQTSGANSAGKTNNSFPKSGSGRSTLSSPGIRSEGSKGKIKNSETAKSVKMPPNLPTQTQNTSVSQPSVSTSPVTIPNNDPVSPQTTSAQSQSSSDTDINASTTEISKILESNQDSSIQLPLEGQHKSRKRSDHSRSNTPRTSTNGSSAPKLPVPETVDENTAGLLQTQETLKMKLHLIERKETLASRSPVFHAPRSKCHWDYLLDEVQWMAIDYRQERRWKLAQSNAISKCCVERLSEFAPSTCYSKWISNLGETTRNLIYSEPVRKRKYHSFSERKTDFNLLSENKHQAKQICDAYIFGMRSRFLSPVVSDPQGIQIKQELPEISCIPKVKRENRPLSDDELFSFGTKLMDHLSEIRNRLLSEEPTKVNFPTTRVEWKDPQRELLIKVQKRIQLRLGTLIHGKHGSGKTAIGASLVSSWISKKIPTLIISSELSFYRWRYELRRFSPEVKFSILDRSTSQQKSKLLQQIMSSDVVFCSSLADFRATMDTLRDVQWSGIMIDTRMFATIDRAEEGCWDVDQSPPSLRPAPPPGNESTGTVEIRPEKYYCEKKIRDHFHSWITSGSELFLNFHIPRCCISTITLVPIPNTPSESSATLVVPWLYFFFPEKFLDRSTDPSIVEQWWQWHCIKLGQSNSPLFLEFTPLCTLELKHWADSFSPELVIEHVDMTVSQRVKYHSALAILNQFYAFNSSNSLNDSSFQSFVAAILVLQKICFHEDFIQFSKLSARSGSTSSKRDGEIEHFQFSSIPNLKDPRPCPKLEAFTKIYHENRDCKIVLVVNHTDEAIYAHQFLLKNRISHLFAGLDKYQYKDREKFDHWFLAQKAIMEFNRTLVSPDSPTNLLLVNGWLLREDYLDEGKRLNSNFRSLFPTSVDLTVILSSDWTFEHDFRNWYVTSIKKQQIIKLVHNETLEGELAVSYNRTREQARQNWDLQEFVELIPSLRIEDDHRYRCPFSSIQGLSSAELFPNNSSDYNFLGAAPSLSCLRPKENILQENQPVSSIQSELRSKVRQALDWIQSFRSFERKLEQKFSSLGQRNRANHKNEFQLNFPFLSLSFDPEETAGSLLLKQRMLWTFDEAIIQSPSPSPVLSLDLILYIFRDLSEEILQDKSSGFVCQLSEVDISRISRNGYGIPFVEFPCRQLYEPYLSPKLPTITNDHNFGVDLLGAMRSTLTEVERQGLGTEKLLYTNPLQISTGRDIVECPSWISSKLPSSVKFSVYFGPSQMTFDPFSDSQELKAKQKSTKVRKTQIIVGDNTSTALSIPTRPNGVEDTPPILSTTTGCIKSTQKPKFSGSLRYNPCGTGWHKINSIVRRFEEPPLPSPTIAAAFLSTMPLGRDGKKYKHSGERRFGGFSVLTPSPTSQMVPKLDSIRELIPAKNLSELPYSILPLDIAPNKTAIAASGPQVWTHIEMVTLENALSYTHSTPRQNLGGGWLLERFLDQVSSLTNLRNRSARQTTEFQDFVDKPHRKRHFDEINSEEKDGFSEKHRGFSFLSSHGTIPERTIQLGIRQISALSEDSRILPIHPSHEVSSVNPNLKPYQVLALSRDQPLEMNFYSRGNGKIPESSRHTNTDYLSFDQLPPKQVDRYSHALLSHEHPSHQHNHHSHSNGVSQVQQKSFPPTRPQSQSKQTKQPHRQTDSTLLGIGSIPPPPQPIFHQNQNPPLLSPDLNVAHLKQITEKNPNLKAELIDILSQTNISDHRKGELLVALMEKKKLNDQHQGQSQSLSGGGG